MKEIYKDEFNTWQRWFAKLTTMWRINRDSVDFKWGYFAPRFGFSFKLNRGGYFDQHYSINLCLIWGYFSIKLPFKTRLEEGCDPPHYGIEIHDDTLWIHLGGDYDNSMGQTQSKWITWALPFFSYEYDGHWVLVDDEWVVVDRAVLGICDNEPEPDRETHPFVYQ
jgi:hypothetical protein